MCVQMQIFFPPPQLYRVNVMCAFVLVWDAGALKRYLVAVNVVYFTLQHMQWPIFF